MRLRVRDFGPVRETDIALRRLTVFVGPNGVGKSYMAYLIWSLYTAEPDWRKLTETIKEHVEGRLGDVEGLRDGIRGALIRIIRGEFAEIFSGGLRQKLLEVYLVDDLRRLVRVGADSAEVLVTSDDGGSAIRVTLKEGELVMANPTGISLEEALSRLDVKLAELTRESAEVSVVIGDEKIYTTVINTGSLNDVIVNVAASVPYIIYVLFDGYAPYVPVAIFPDSRAGILRARGPLVYLLLRERYMPSTINDVDASFLAYVEGLPGVGERDARLLDIAGLVEEGVGARFAVDPSAPGRLLVERGGFRSALAGAPSGFRELAPLVYALKYGPLPGIVIVEEPETHLHPRAQSVAARALAALASYAGRTVIVTTHSIHVIDEFNGLVRLRGLSAEEKGRLGYREWEGLKPDDVAIYAFTSDGHVRGVEVTDEGMDETELDRAVIELGNRHALIEGALRGRGVPRKMPK